MDRLLDWHEKRRRAQKDKKVKDQHRKEFNKCKKSLIDLLIEYGRIEKGVRDVYKTEGTREGLKGFQLTSFINRELEKNKQLNESLINKIAKKLKCGDKNQELKPCVDDKNAPNKCSAKETYEERARMEAKTWTVSYLQDQIKKLEDDIKELEDDTRRDKDDEESLKRYRELLETDRKRLETVEAASQQKPRSRNSWNRKRLETVEAVSQQKPRSHSWSLESTEMTLKF